MNLLILKRISLKIVITAFSLWFVFSAGVFGFLIQDIYSAYKHVNSRGTEYVTAINKLAVDDSWHNLSEDESDLIFKYYNSNFKYKYTSATVEEVLSVELDNKFFFGRNSYVHPFWLIGCLIFFAFLPVLIANIIYYWAGWILSNEVAKPNWIFKYSKKSNSDN